MFEYFKLFDKIYRNAIFYRVIGVQDFPLQPFVNWDPGPSTPGYVGFVTDFSWFLEGHVAGQCGFHLTESCMNNGFS